MICFHPENDRFAHDDASGRVSEDTIWEFVKRTKLNVLSPELHSLSRRLRGRLPVAGSRPQGSAPEFQDIPGGFNIPEKKFDCGQRCGPSILCTVLPMIHPMPCSAHLRSSLSFPPKSHAVTPMGFFNSMSQKSVLKPAIFSSLKDGINQSIFQDGDGRLHNGSHHCLDGP